MVDVRKSIATRTHGSNSDQALLKSLPGLGLYRELCGIMAILDGV